MQEYSLHQHNPISQHTLLSPVAWSGVPCNTSTTDSTPRLATPLLSHPCVGVLSRQPCVDSGEASLSAAGVHNGALGRGASCTHADLPTGSCCNCECLGLLCLLCLLCLLASLGFSLDEHPVTSFGSESIWTSNGRALLSYAHTYAATAFSHGL